MDNKYMHKTWKRHENGVYWVDINLVLKKGLKLYQTGLNALIHYDTLPAYCIPKTIMMGLVEIIYESVHASLRLHVCSCFCLVARSNQCGSKNPNQVHRQKNQFVDILTNGNFTRDECNHELSLCKMSQFMSTVWSEAIAKNFGKFRRRTSHSEIGTNDEFWCKGAVERIVSDFSKLGEEKIWKLNSLEPDSWERGENRATWCRQRPKDRIWLLSWTILWKLFLRKILKVGLITKLGLLKSGKLTLRCVSDRDNPLTPLEKRHVSLHKFLSQVDPALWNSAIHCEQGNTSWHTGVSRCHVSKRNNATAFYHWKRNQDHS